MKNFILISSLLTLIVICKSNSYGQDFSKKYSEMLVEGRPTDLQGCLNVHDTLLVINYWDCAIEDNDTISLNLNGQWILQRIRLTNAKKELRIKVQPGENFLTLFAHNLGDLPNNTAAMSVREQYTNQEISMTSNLLVSGTTRIACYIGNPSVLMNTLPPCVKKELNTAASDDVKNEIRLYNEKLAQANKAPVIQTNNSQHHASNSGSKPKPSGTYYPKPPVSISIPSRKSPAPVKKTPTQKTPPVNSGPKGW